MAVLVLQLLAASFVLPQQGWTSPARRTLSAVCQSGVAPTPDVSDGAGEQGDPRSSKKPADHRKNLVSSQASQAVEQHARPITGRPATASASSSSKRLAEL
eukprot:scaffold11285_cov45-Phaeocystis_antarctica.AAC.4